MSKLKNIYPLILMLLLVLAACSTAGTESQDETTNTVNQRDDEDVLESDSASEAEVEVEVEVEEEVVVSAESDASNEETLVSTSDTGDPTAEAQDDAAIARPSGWSEETHSNDADPNYAVVFPEDHVNAMTITISSENWQAMLDNMTELYGAAGVGGDQGGRGGGRPAVDFREILPEGCELPEGFVPGPNADWPEGCEPDPAAFAGRGGDRPQGGRGGAGGGAGGGINVGGSENPDYAAATIEFEGDVWTNVGVRFKGNSTLTRGWNSGSLALPFKLDFDEYEDDYPEIDDQRFHGFKQLSLQNPGADESYVRASLAYDVMQEVGLIAPETAWYELFVDYGEGPISFGLYTVIEVVDDSVIQTALGDDDGNIYEGDGEGVSLAEGTFDQIADSFEKENNDENDYSDLEALYNALHADTRLTNADQWRSDLEAVFDVDTFLKWLAVNTVIVNWDTYGEMAHNFYIYHDTENDLLTWIGWDYNESIQPGRRGGTTSLSQAEESADWPLIRYLLDEPAYYAQYVAHVQTVSAGAFDATTIAAQLTTWETMLAPYVSDSANFATNIETIKNFVETRQDVVATFLSATESSVLNP